MGGKTYEKSNKYAVKLAHILRQLAVVVSFVTILYAIMAEWGFVSRSSQYSLLGSVIISILVVLFALWAYFRPYKTQSSKLALFIIPFHAIGVALPLLITGFMSPMTMLWLILIVVTGTFMGKYAMALSSSVLFVTALSSLALDTRPVDATYIVVAIDHLVYATVIVILAWFVGSLRLVHDTEHEDFVKAEHQRTIEQSRLMTLINSLNEAVISINSAGTIQLYNAAMLNLLDTNKSLNGSNVDEQLVFRNTEGEPYTLLKSLKKGKPSMYIDDLVYTFEDGESIRIGLSTSRIRDDKNAVIGYILVLRDITREKSLDEERDEFISVVSHELRTPIAIAEGTVSNVEMLIQKNAAPSVVAQALKMAHDQIVFLARMINDLGTLSRAERGVGSEPERINVQEFAHEIFKEYEPKAQAKHLKLNLDMHGNPGYIKVSRLYLEEVLQNFFTNAIKYTQRGSITFIVRPHKGQVEFGVRDTGIGISKKEHAKIFEKFYRSEDYRTRETNGTGLGLYIVHKLAKKLGTQIQLESRLNHGSTFTIALPLSSGLDNQSETE